MSDDMRLLILTHLRAAMERKDWRAVEKAASLLRASSHIEMGELGYAAATRDWRGVSRVYVALGGVGCGEPAKSPGGTEKARDGASEGAAA